jgi:iron complex transport system permease protein
MTDHADAATRGRTRPAAVGRWLPPLLLIGVILLSCGVGKYAVSPADLFSLLIAKMTGGTANVDTAVETVVWQIRLPRVLAGVLVGAALAASGAAYQGMFRNPLVSPDILGVSAGAGLGAALGIFFSLPVAAIQALAFIGGLLAVGAVYLIGTAIRRHDPILVLVLTGIAVGALLGAAISLIKVLADPYDQLPAITYWLLGSLTGVTQGDIIGALPAVLIGLLPLYLLRWRMNLLSLSEDEARALGVSTGRLRLLFIAAATLITSATVAIAGIVGWVGLLIPHVARILVGPEFARLLPAALMLGAGFLVAVDALARTAAAIEMPLGILTAVIGAPFFLWLLAAARRGWQ